MYRSLWAQIFEKKVSNFSKTPKKTIHGPILGQDRLEKNSAKSLFEAARLRVLDRHRATKTTTAPWNLNGARPLGAPTHSLATVFTKRRVIGGGRRPGFWYKHVWALLCRNQATKNLDPSPMAKNRPFSRFETLEHWTPRATSRPLDHGSAWYWPHTQLRSTYCKTCIIHPITLVTTSSM